MRGDGYTLHANSVHPQNQDQKIYFLSFYQNSIYGIIIIKVDSQFPDKEN